MRKVKIFFKDILTQLRFISQSINNQKLIITVIHCLAIVWASIVSITYLGCLDSPLICPRAFFSIPYTDNYILIPFTELPNLILVIIMSSVNLSTLYAFEKIHRFQYITVGIVIFLVAFSLIFISSVASFETVFYQEYIRIQNNLTNPE